MLLIENTVFSGIVRCCIIHMFPAIPAKLSPKRQEIFHTFFHLSLKRIKASVAFFRNLFCHTGKRGGSPRQNRGNTTGYNSSCIDGYETIAAPYVDNLFLVDTIQNIMKHISQITGVEYGKNEKSDVSLRVITDHIRSTTFMIGDGVLRQTRGKGYVLRRLSGAPLDGKLLGYNEPFSSIRFAIRLSKKISQLIPNSRKSRSSLQRLSRLRKKALPRCSEHPEYTSPRGFSLYHHRSSNAGRRKSHVCFQITFCTPTHI